MLLSAEFCGTPSASYTQAVPEDPGAGSVQPGAAGVALPHSDAGVMAALLTNAPAVGENSSRYTGSAMPGVGVRLPSPMRSRTRKLAAFPVGDAVIDCLGEVEGVADALCEVVVLAVADEDGVPDDTREVDPLSDGEAVPEGDEEAEPLGDGDCDGEPDGDEDADPLSDGEGVVEGDAVADALGDGVWVLEGDEGGGVALCDGVGTRDDDVVGVVLLLGAAVVVGSGVPLELLVELLAALVLGVGCGVTTTLLLGTRITPR